MSDSRDITKRQHYHMRAILKNFSIGEQLSIFYKDNSTDNLSYEDKAFYGYMAWSDETETRYGAAIERKGLGQIRHILNTHTVSAHQDITDYHILWRLRHMYAVTPEPPAKIYEGFDFGTSDEAKAWANRNGKMYINGDGTTDGMFAATLRIKDGLDKYRKDYGNIFWSVGISENIELISADCYKNSLMFPLSPNLLLLGQRKKEKKPSILSAKEVIQVNQMAKDECYSFCFGRPSKGLLTLRQSGDDGCQI